MNPNQFAEFSLRQSKRSAAGPQHDGMLHSLMAFQTGFNSFFPAHYLALSNSGKYLIIIDILLFYITNFNNYYWDALNKYENFSEKLLNLEFKKYDIAFNVSIVDYYHG